MILSFFSDFCASWPFWWISPFVLGCLFGYFTWGTYKSKLTKLQNELREQRALGYKFEKLLKQCENDVSEKNKDIQLEKSNNLELQRKLRKSQQQLSAQNASHAKSIEAKATSKNDLGTIGPQLRSPQSPQANIPSKEQSKRTTVLKSSNLQIIQGIGPKIETLLFENGIKNWEDLSSKSFGELRAMLDNYGTRYSIVDPSDWSKQASLAHKSKWKALIKLQNEIGNSSKLQRVLLRLGLA